jgi:hypothetical protein
MAAARGPRAAGGCCLLASRPCRHQRLPTTTTQNKRNPGRPLAAIVKPPQVVTCHLAIARGSSRMDREDLEHPN